MKALLLGLLAALLAGAADARPFSFVAYGDTAYRVPRDEARFVTLIDAINRERPAFSIHVGDLKGYSPCSDDGYRQRKAMLMRHAHPVLLTPGDNDWADCGVEEAGGFDPIERLSAFRTIFFGDDRSLGQQPIRVTRQGAFPENALWHHENLVFATVHVIGPHNGLITDKRRAAESIDRIQAGREWVRQAFAVARKRSAPAVVIAFQADAWIAAAPVYEDGPFNWLRQAIGEEAAKFAGQVLAIHGDSHRLIVDTPYRRADIAAGSTSGMNVTRLQVPGWPDHRAVRVDVDPASPAMFRFGLVMNPDEASGARP